AASHTPRRPRATSTGKAQIPLLPGPWCTEKHADGGLLVRLLHVAIQGLEIKLQLTLVLGLEFLDFQLNRHQAVEAPVKEEQVKLVIAPSDLDGVIAADEAKIAAEFDEEVLEFFDETAVKVFFCMPLWQVEEIERIRILEYRERCGMRNSRHR